MSYQVRSTAPRSRSIPPRNRLTQPAAAPQVSAGTADTVLDEEVLDRLLKSLHKAAQQAPSLDRAIRLPEVLCIVGVSKSTWYARLNPRSPSHDPRAPHPFKLGPSLHSPSVWWRSAVMAYVQACAAPQAISAEGSA